MKSKLFTFAILSIFLLSLVAAVTLTVTTSPQTLTKDNNQTSFVITSDGATDFSISSSNPIITDDDGNQAQLSITNSGLTNVTSVTFDVDLDSVHEDFALGESYSTTVTVSETGSEQEIITLNFENDFCEAGNVGDLSIEDLDFDVTGFSEDDEEWYILDNVEVTFEVENNGNDDVDDVEVEWGLYNTRTHEFIIDDDDSFGDIKDDDTETLTFDFDVDADEFDEDDGENDFVFFIKAYGDKDGEDVHCVSEATNIRIVKDQNFVILHDIEIPKTASQGDTVTIKADVWNIGEDDEEDVVVILVSDGLGINEQFDIGDIDVLEDESLTMSFEVPTNVESKSYFVELYVLDEDGDVFENDDDDESYYYYSIEVSSNGGEGSENNVHPVVVSVDSLSSVKPGDSFTVTATVTNPNTETITYQVLATNHNEWATLDSIAPETFTLAGGDSKTVNLVFESESSVSGNREFLVQVVYEGTVAEQPVSVNFAGGSIFPKLTGGAIGGGLGSNAVKLAIIANVILVILIIVVASRMARASKESEED